MSTTATRAHATGCGIGRPASAASRFSTAISAILARVRRVAEPRCGTTSRFGASSSGWSPGSGSGSVTSSAAPPIAAVDQRLAAARPGRRSPPRAVLTSSAVGFMRASARSSIRCRVSGVSGVCSETTSARSSSSSSGHAGRARAVHDLHPEARRRGARPPRRSGPRPTMPSVAPARSVPRSPAGSHVRHSPARTVSAPDTIPPREREDEREREVGRRVGQHVGRVADRDAAGRRGLEVDVVGPDREVGDRPQVRARRRAAPRRPDR